MMKNEDIRKSKSFNITNIIAKKCAKMSDDDIS